MSKNNEYIAVGTTDRSDATTTPLNDVDSSRSDAEAQSAKTSKCSKAKGLKGVALGLVPIADWLPRYKWKEWISGDIIAGLTVGIMHVPQGMAYASLASVPPVVGMYSSFFAAFVYMFFGTSKHISIGVFAVASMMVGACQLRLMPSSDDPLQSMNGTHPFAGITPVQFTSALTFTVGIVQIVLGIFRLSFVTTYLSDALVNGFTTGAAAHVMMSQLNKVFGVKLPRHEGVGMLVKMAWDIILALPQTNLVAFGISVFGILFLYFGREYLNPIVKKYSKIPLPLELILVIIGVITSIVFNLNENYGVKIVNTIPRGFPGPSLPKVSLFTTLLPDAIPIGIVCYIFVMSLGKLFAKKHKYRTDATQELYAVGAMSALASFFPVYPVGASLSRSAVCEMSGANTMLYTLFSSSLLLTVIFFLGPFLEPLPMCILACIVIVSLKSMFMQVKELPYLWKVCKFDCAIWVIACLATILTDITTGLIISTAFAVFSVVLREQWPAQTFVQHVPTSPQHCPESIKIFKFSAPLHFANVVKFCDNLAEVLNPDKKEDLLETDAVVVDCSAIAYIDAMGVDAIKEVYFDGKNNGVKVVFACLHDDILAMLKKIDFFDKVPSEAFCISVDAAILSILSSKRLVNA